jgi:ubiquinone/menaquinone biosynthesis C-methylase UbiE
MALSRIQQLIDDIRTRHPRSAQGILEARAVDPAQFDELGERFLNWLAVLKGDSGIRAAIDSYIRFTTSVNLSQVRYEADGHYENKTYEECYQSLYNSKEEMDDYLWGIYLTNFLWRHHMEISLFFRDRFLARLPEKAMIIELAPGHGGWGVWALSERPDAQLIGYDISPSSIAIATSLAQAAGVGSRASYFEKSALDLDGLSPEIATACICSFVVEHLEEPQKLFAAIARLLKVGGRAFITGALTAAQIDHIYEFREESELVRICEQAGLRVLETLSVGPSRTLPKARFLPRSMVLLVQKRQPGLLW